MSKHYEATKDLTAQKLERYMQENLEVGDIVRAGPGSDYVIIARTPFPEAYFWARPVNNQGATPVTLTPHDMDIKEGM